MFLSKMTTVLVVAMWLVMKVPTTRSGDPRLCFCNSPVCIQSVCETQGLCYVKADRQATSKNGNYTAWIKYGCEEDLDPKNESCSSDISTESSGSALLCCKQPDLCNMPNLLRAIILSGDEKHKDTQQRPSRSRDTTPGCINVGPMKLVCLLVPSIMVVFAMLLALAMIHKVAKFHANQIKASKGTVAYLTDDRISLTFEEETSSDAIGLKMNNYDMA